MLLCIFMLYKDMQKNNKEQLGHISQMQLFIKKMEVPIEQIQYELKDRGL